MRMNLRVMMQKNLKESDAEKPEGDDDAEKSDGADSDS